MNDIIPCPRCRDNTIHVSHEMCWKCSDRDRHHRNMMRTVTGMPFAPIIWSLVALFIAVIFSVTRQ